jgi:hypothetical protein
LQRVVLFDHENNLLEMLHELLIIDSSVPIKISEQIQRDYFLSCKFKFL